MKRLLFSLVILTPLLANGVVYGQQPYRSQAWSPDTGKGGYKNPIIYADYSDPDMVRVGEDYYMTASSFNCVPALPILHSRDMVNWTIVNYALRELRMEGVTEGFFDRPQHGRGVWAPSIRHHNGEFMIYWGDPDFGIYVVKTKDPLGRWDEPILVLPGKGRIDPCPLFDDDGRVYLTHAWAASRARFNSVLTVCEMNSDGTKAIGEEVLVFDGNDGVNYTIEGAKFYKKDGWYYLLAPAGGVAMGWQLSMRAKSIYGPYEAMRTLEQGATEVNGPHQGALVDSPNGEWWFSHFQDKGVYGRIVHLQPVVWKDGWPVMGVNDKNYCGEPVTTYRKPYSSVPQQIANPQESDEFNEPKLSLQWQWHANPGQGWAFTSTKGYIRLYGQYYPQDYLNFWDVPNLLMQKWSAPVFTATTKMTAVLMNEGDRAGLIVMGYDYAHFALVKTQQGYALEQTECQEAEQKNTESIVTQTPLNGLDIEERWNYKTLHERVTLYLRMSIAEGGVCRFSYSLDGAKFRELGKPFQAREGKWIGAKSGLFIMNKTGDTPRSWIDVDWFRITKK